MQSFVSRRKPNLGTLLLTLRKEDNFFYDSLGALSTNYHKGPFLYINKTIAGIFIKAR
jgi:hypothetical protein